MYVYKGGREGSVQADFFLERILKGRIVFRYGILYSVWIGWFGFIFDKTVFFERSRQ